MFPQPLHNALIDTDIGDDVDDAFGLALALVLPRLRVAGVTTVAGPVGKRARLAQVLLEAAGCRDVPVAPGSSMTSDGRPGPARFSHDIVEMRDWRLEIGNVSQLQSPAGSAVDLMLECSRRNEPLTLIALGPLTNIAAALRHDPALARRARLVAMAGKLGLPYPDWNLRCDPAAARAVLRSGMPVTLVGMHVTLHCKLRPAQVRRLFSDRRPLSMALARCVLAWRTRRRRMPILHDALTVAVAADPALVRLEQRRVRIGPAGFSIASERGTPNALVCTAVDLERFHALLDSYLLGMPAGALPASGWLDRLVQFLA